MRARRVAARIAIALALATLVVVTPYVSAGPSIIRDEMLQDTAITPALGRGYSIATNTYQSMCLIDVVSTTPSYDFDYSFENIENKVEASGPGIATTKASTGKVTKAETRQKKNSMDGYQLADEWSSSRTETDKGTSSSYQHMLATISINVYYNSVDETKSKLSPAATKILESKDLPGFFDACGMYYVRSISRRARIYSLITYTTNSSERDVKLDSTIKSAIRSFSLTSGQKAPDSALKVKGSASEMIQGQEYVSQNGLYRTVFQADGNLCVYEGAGISDCKAGLTEKGAAAVVEGGGHCYGRFDTTVNQAEAHSTCRGYGGTLATVSNPNENVLVAGLGGGGNPWLDGNDIATEGQFQWTTGEPFTYTNWSSGQPDNSNNEDCVQIMGDGLWNDIPCTNTLPYICEANQAKTVWCSMTNGKGARAVVHNSDMVIYDKADKQVWQTSRDRVGKEGGTQLVMQDDGNLVLMSGTEQALAATGTGPNRMNKVMIGRPGGDSLIATASVGTSIKETSTRQTGNITTKTTSSNIQISTKAIGLGKQLGTMLVSYDIDTYKKAIESAYKATLPDNVGKVSAIEVVPWMENTEFQSLFKLEEKVVPVFDSMGFPVMDLTDLAKPVQKTKKVLPYEQKRILQTNAEFLAEVDRAARAKLNVFYKAKMCRAQIDADYMEMDETTGEMFFPIDRDAIGNAIEIVKASYGANCNPVNVDNMTALLAEACNDVTKCSYKVDMAKLGDPAPACQKAYEVEYRCLAPAPKGFHHLAIAKEANGKNVEIDCVATKKTTTPPADDSSETAPAEEATQPTIGQTTYVWNNRKASESLLLEEVVNMLSETKLQRLWMEYDSFMYGGNGDDLDSVEKDPAERFKITRAILLGMKPELGYPRNVFPGAGQCIGELFSVGITVQPYRSIKYCQRIEETFATISGQRIDDYCMPRFTRVPGQESIETAMDKEAKAGDSVARERTAPAAAPPPALEPVGVGTVR